ncbi:MAG: permease-like cell division protein FtsX [Lachnospiraceae bacterium]|jgi:cell division transport system permease protein
MRLSTIFYILKQGVKNIFRNIRFSLASVGTMAACIFLFGIFLAIVMNFRYIVHTAEEGVAITVFFDEDTSQEQIDAIGQDIRNRPEVKDVVYMSAEDAWDQFKDNYFGESADMLAEGFKEDNPLANSASYAVYVENIESQTDLVEFIEGLEGVRSVNQSKVAADTLSTFNTLIGYVSLAIIAILLAVAFFLISNTITMGISIRREEIGIMKLIGATDFFVRSPFIIEGILIGCVGAAIPLIILYFLYNEVIQYILERFHMLANIMQFLPVGNVYDYLLPVGLGLGIGIGFLGSIFSVRKHLRV